MSCEHAQASGLNDAHAIVYHMIYNKEFPFLSLHLATLSDWPEDDHFKVFLNG